MTRRPRAVDLQSATMRVPGIECPPIEPLQINPRRSLYSLRKSISLIDEDSFA